MTHSAKDLPERIAAFYRCVEQCPLMKLVDMYFWQIGFESNTKGSRQ